MRLVRTFKTLALAAALAAATGQVAAQSQTNLTMDAYLATKVQVANKAFHQADTFVVAVPEGAEVRLAGWSKATVEQVQRALKAAQFEGKVGQLETVLAPVGLKVDRLIFVGVGTPATVERYKIEEAGAALAAAINRTKATKVSVDGSLMTNATENGRILAQLAHGVDLRNYRFDRFKSKPAARPAQEYHYHVGNSNQAQQEFSQLRALAEGVFIARELTNLPGSSGYPAAFVEYARQALEPLGVDVTILGPEQVKALGMGALYGVSQGSQHKAYLLVAHYRGNQDQPIALVGKGISFDTGGYNLKASGGSIGNMQTDKAGAAAVVGAIAALAGQKANVNVVGLAPLAHNLISGEAQLPGDVVTTGAGLTIEVANTDAEGRLVLADGLWYAREYFKPRAIADIATLTGAKMTAVGTEYAGVFANNEQVYQTMLTAAELVRERVWRLPLDPAFESSIASRIADMKNTGSPGASAGAMLLQRFVGDTPWIHIDIAGNALVSGDQGIHPRGATGFGVRLLSEWVKAYPTDE